MRNVPQEIIDKLYAFGEEPEPTLLDRLWDALLLLLGALFVLGMCTAVAVYFIIGTITGCF